MQQGYGSRIMHMPDHGSESTLETQHAIAPKLNVA